ncbi:MAG: ABC transporter permease subunit [Lacrimispora saccharolytica]
MKTLIKYEFLKILRKKSTLIVMAASLLITAFFFGLPVLQFQTYNQDGVLQGLAGIQYEKEQYTEISVPLTNEYVTKTIREVQELFEDPENVGYDGNEQFLIEDAYWNGIAPRESLLDLIAGNYADPNVSAGYSALTDLDVSDGTDFYQARQDKIEKILNDSSKELSEAEKDYWRNLNSKVEEPFQYGYYEGWEVIISAFELLMFAVLAVCIVIAPVFSGEYQAGTDAVLLSGKYGKTKLTTAKILAALFFGVLAFTLHVLLAFGLPLAAFGTDGWNLPLQINGTTVPYPLTFLEGTLINLGVIYLVLLAMIGVTLFLSARMKSPYLVLTVVVPVLFVPMFLSPNGTSGIYNLLVFLTPYKSLVPNFGSYLSYQFGPVVLDAFAVRTVLYAVLALILLPLAGRGFRRHQAA